MATQTDQYGNIINNPAITGQPLTGASNAVLQEGDSYNLNGKNYVLSPEGTLVPPFNPELPSVLNSGDVNKAISSPTDITALEVGQVGRATGDQTVYLRSANNELRGFTSPAALQAAGFDFKQVKILTPNLVASFQKGAPINEIIAKTIPFIIENNQIKDATGLNEEQNKINTLTKQIGDVYANIPSERAKLRAEANATYDVTNKLSRLSDVEKSIIDFQGSVDLKEEELRNQPGVINNIIEGSVGRLRRIADIHLKTLFAQKAALEGDFNRAFNLANQATTDAFSDRMTQIQGMQFVLQQESANVNQKQQEAASALQYSLTEKYNKLQLEQKMQEERTQVYLALQEKYPRAAISPSMTYGEMFKAAAPFAAKKEALDLKALELDMDLKRSQIAKNARESSVDEKNTRLAPISAAISGIPRGTDGYMDPKAYQELALTYGKLNPGKAQEFLDAFPIELYIAPENRPQFLKSNTF